MKTNFKTTVLALALLASVTGAFASNIVNVISGREAIINYTWQKYESDGTTPDGSPQPGTQTNPFPENCPNGSEVLCAQGTPVIPGSGPVIRVYYPL